MAIGLKINWVLVVLVALIIIFIANMIHWQRKMKNDPEFRNRMESMKNHHNHSMHDFSWDKEIVSAPTAIEILNERYAKGEINDKDFLNRKRHLLMTESEIKEVEE